MRGLRLTGQGRETLTSDRRFYNRTKHSGLETHIANSYVNALLQLLFHTSPLRRIAESHATQPCPTGNCILCELGFLFKMLASARGVNCQATNFLRAFAANPRATSLDLVDGSSTAGVGGVTTGPNKSYSAMIQLCHHFLLDQVSDDVKTTPLMIHRADGPDSDPSTAPIADVFGMDWSTVQTCPCGHTTSRPSQTRVVEFVYPRRALSNEPPPAGDLPSILRASLIRETTGKALCPSCNQTTHQRWRRVPAPASDPTVKSRGFPPVLALNAAVSTPDQLEFWIDSRTRREGRFLQPRLGISTVDGTAGASLMIGDDVTAPMPRGDKAAEYELAAMVLQIQAEDDPPHLVAVVKVPRGEGGDEEGAWYLFNDFLVRRISEEEALSFSGTWKVGSCLVPGACEVDVVADPGGDVLHEDGPEHEARFVPAADHGRHLDPARRHEPRNVGGPGRPFERVLMTDAQAEGCCTDQARAARRGRAAEAGHARRHRRRICLAPAGPSSPLRHSLCAS